jgi:hypothetical protein
MEPDRRENNLSDVEKSHHAETETKPDTEVVLGAYLVEQDALPPGYFTSRFFIGTMVGIGMGLMGGVAGFG